MGNTQEISQIKGRVANPNQRFFDKIKSYDHPDYG